MLLGGRKLESTQPNGQNQKDKTTNSNLQNST